MPIPELTSTFQKLLGGAPSAIALVDPPCQLVWANEAFFDAFPATRGGLGGSLHGMAGVGSLPQAVEEVLEKRGSTTLREITLPGGHRERADLWIWTLPGADPARTHALVMVSPSEERAREHERARLYYESFLTSNNAIEITDQNGILVDVNPAFEKIYGYRRTECLGKKPNLVRSRQTPRIVYEGMWKDILDPSIGHWSGEIMNRDRLGKERPVFLTISAIRDAQGTITNYVGVAVNLTEQRQWERGAARAERMASLGQLAAGVAHEINTPLANISLVAESIKMRSTDPWLSARCEALIQHTEVAARIVHGLLDFSRRTEPHLTELDLTEVVRATVEFLRGKQSADVELEEHYPREPLPILGDRGQLMQVFTNVLNNAYDAIEGEGKVIIRVLADGNEAEVEVADSGPGIPPDVLPRLFEPFFTTKEEGRGTGLGLAICLGILQAHRGSIDAHNLLGRGASFLVRIPLRPTPAEAHPTA